MPSTVSMPPNSSTAALDTVASTPRLAATSAISDGGVRLASMAARSAPNASVAAGGIGRPAEMPDTAALIASYQANTVSAWTSARPSTSASTATANGPANSRRSSAVPRGRRPSSSRSVWARIDAEKRVRTAAGRKAGPNGSRWWACAGPSVESMLGPTTRAVEKRGSSTVNVPGSRSTASTSG